MANNSNVRDDKKGIRLFVTILAYVFFVVAAVAVLPVVLPMIFGYQTHTVSIDTTGTVNQVSSVVYTDKSAASELVDGNVVALELEDGKKVKVCYVSSNNTEDQTITLRTNEVVAYDKVVGHVVAQTPFIGVLTQLCDAVLGIAFVVFVFIVGVVLAIIANRLVVKAKPKASAN